ncbi:MAG: hypothetical protein CMA60_00310 [Euryarchaeota archaeon]|nr:hypothetical protein [Euryarchaeota archaeon]
MAELPKVVREELLEAFKLGYTADMMVGIAILMKETPVGGNLKEHYERQQWADSILSVADEIAELFDCECITTDMSGKCVDCLRTPEER